jgi:hypothetical protein
MNRRTLAIAAALACTACSPHDGSTLKWTCAAVTVPDAMPASAPASFREPQSLSVELRLPTHDRASRVFVRLVARNYDARFSTQSVSTDSPLAHSSKTSFVVTGTRRDPVSAADLPNELNELLTLAREADATATQWRTAKE